MDDEGFLYLTGRKKNLIILSNGENVAPEQLEYMFEDERLIGDILVFEENDAIAAEVYPNFPYAQAAGITDIKGAVQEIVRKHNQGLPSYKKIMICRLRDVPFEKTSSKKIIRPAYFIQKKEEAKQIANLVLPKNELQTKLYDLAAAALGHRRFGIDTDLYEAGLDSPESGLLLSDLSSSLKVSMTLDDLMSCSSIEKLEAFCLAAGQTSPVDYSLRPVYPLTNLQVYFAYVMKGNTTANLPFFFKLDPAVDLERLKQSAEELFEIHPGLKSGIWMGEKGYANFRDDGRKVDIPIITLTDKEWEQVRPTLLKPFYYLEGSRCTTSASTGPVPPTTCTLTSPTSWGTA